jgi:hypothetical protein
MDFAGNNNSRKMAIIHFFRFQAVAEFAMLMDLLTTDE